MKGILRAFLWVIIMVQAPNKSSNSTTEYLKSVASGNKESRVKALKELFDYPIIEQDISGSRFWYLRPGVSKEIAKETCPIAVGFYSELNNATERKIRDFLTTKDPQPEIYRHYLGQAGDVENQPVMYILLPEATDQEKVVLVLPTEGGIKQRQIQVFDSSDRELLGRLERLKLGNLKIIKRGLAEIPLIDWVFYPGIKTAKKLANLMADIARDIERAIPTVAKNQGTDGYINKLFASFKKELLPTLKLKADDDKDYSFADIYAQTVAYGLFTARVFSYIQFKQYQKKHSGYDIEPDFYRDNAWEFLPETNPFLRKLFKDISNQKPEALGEELVSSVSELLSVLRAAEMEAVLLDFQQKVGQEDIIIRFYENFLDAYNPSMRERRGVYYTPQPVVSYIVRSVDHILKQDFGLADGLADASKISAKSTDRKKTKETHKVLITDPAVGTGTFLHEVINHIHRSFEDKPEQWSNYVSQDLLPRLLGFELLMAPYAVAHMKLGLQLAELGYQFNPKERLGVYLTNSLQEAFQIPQNEEHLSKLFWGEADAANRIKEASPVMVILGNPPYSGHSANNGDWIKNLLRGKDTVTQELCSNYFEVDGKQIRDKGGLKWLNDDYVKFIRFGQWRIERTGYGILAFVTNHSYLDNPTFRGMRQSLMKTFDDIYVLDLHGNSLKKEHCPDGSNDKNVFDIRQGVAISIFVKSPNVNKDIASIYHADLYGNRETKYSFLQSNNINKVDWTIINPQSPHYLFVPQETELLEEYKQGWKVSDIFNQNGDPAPGIVTTHDKFAISWSKDEAIEKVETLLHTKTETEARSIFKLCSQNQWQYIRAKSELEDRAWHEELLPVLYRPFDVRWTVYNRNVAVHRRERAMNHMHNGNNLALVTSRLTKGETFRHTQVTGNIAEVICMSPKTSNNGFVFPLYLYPSTNQSEKSLLEEQRRPNLSPNFLKAIENNLGYTPTPETIFHYIYAILHSPTYRDRYSEYLKRDFPRIPLASNDELFRKLANYGEHLVQLHLMTSSKLDNLITEFVEENDRSVNIGSATKAYSDGAVKLNKKGDRFTGVPEEVWNFYVGGYQVCHKWLKDRKGRTLSDEDILHYQKIVVALKETMELMTKIDKAIPGFPIK